MVRDISWVAFDVTKKHLTKFKHFNESEEWYFHEHMEREHPEGFITHLEGDIVKLEKVMVHLGYELVSNVEHEGFTRYLFVWKDERWYPLKEAYMIASRLVYRTGVTINGMLLSGDWLHVLENDSVKASQYNDGIIVTTLSLQHELSNGSYVIHHVHERDAVVRVEGLLSAEDKLALIYHNTSLVKMFKAIDNAINLLIFQ